MNAQHCTAFPQQVNRDCENVLLQNVSRLHNRTYFIYFILFTKSTVLDDLAFLYFLSLEPPIGKSDVICRCGSTWLERRKCISFAPPAAPLTACRLMKEGLTHDLT